MENPVRLKPCMFCGGKPVFGKRGQYNMNDKIFKVVIFCRECGYMISANPQYSDSDSIIEKQFNNHVDAAMSWNAVNSFECCCDPHAVIDIFKNPEPLTPHSELINPKNKCLAENYGD